jgi:hypothetical protein
MSDYVEPHHFSPLEQKEMSLMIHRVKDGLLSQKGKMVTPVHYAPRIARPGQVVPEEQYGLLCHRVSPHMDRRGVLINKSAHGQFYVSFHVDFGVLTEDDKNDPQACEERRSQIATGVKAYGP